MPRTVALDQVTFNRIGDLLDELEHYLADEIYFVTCSQCDAPIDSSPVTDLINELRPLLRSARPTEDPAYA